MKVFISYSGSDEKWANLLRQRLPQEGIDVWNPGLEIAPGENWGLKYGKGLEASDAMIVLLSPDSAKSDWVRHEIEYALSAPRFRDRLIPVLVRPTADIPWILAKQKIIRAGKDIDETVRAVASALKDTKAAA
ncbi:MAG: toll/interleukin-1 receptor domain-containing protein [Chthoniobacteraceae bacterium]